MFFGRAAGRRAQARGFCILALALRCGSSKQGARLRSKRGRIGWASLQTRSDGLEAWDMHPPNSLEGRGKTCFKNLFSLLKPSLLKVTTCVLVVPARRRPTYPTSLPTPTSFNASSDEKAASMLVKSAERGISRKTGKAFANRVVSQSQRPRINDSIRAATARMMMIMIMMVMISTTGRRCSCCCS